MQLWVLNVRRRQACSFARVTPEIDIWRAATLMLKRYGEKALEQSATRADELAADGDTTALIPGAGSRRRSFSSPTPGRPDRCTDRTAAATVAQCRPRLLLITDFIKSTGPARWSS